MVVIRGILVIDGLLQGILVPVSDLPSCTHGATGQTCAVVPAVRNCPQSASVLGKFLTHAFSVTPGV